MHLVIGARHRSALSPYKPPLRPELRQHSNPYEVIWVIQQQAEQAGPQRNMQDATLAPLLVDPTWPLFSAAI